VFFNSIEFFIFLFIFLSLYFRSRGNNRLIILVVASLFFYGWYDPRTLLLLILLILFNYFLGVKINNEKGKGQKTLLISGVIINLSILGAFKYTNFFIKAFESFLHLNPQNNHIQLTTLDIILPIGISFYVFEMISYIVDIHRKKIIPETNILKFSLYVSFFPRLVAGPILRPGLFIPQIDTALYKNPTWDTVINGIEIMAWGFFKKIVIADSLAYYVDRLFENPTAYTSLGLVIAIVFYSFQIYCDFSGYSEIAIGLGKITGFDLGINFDRPYFSKSFSEFWQRWHISLSTWLRDYLYIPLGGNRVSISRTYQNLMTTMLLGGLWHGANWTFIIWGVIHGLYLVAQRILTPIHGQIVDFLKIPKRISNIFSVCLVFILTCFAWLFFRAQSLHDAIEIIKIISSSSGNWEFTAVSFQFQAIKGILLCVILYVMEAISFRFAIRKFFNHYPFSRLLAGCLILYSISILGSFQGQTFIYFQF
jgi:alginate O-acetyltransferase complex protein AlgI